MAITLSALMLIPVAGCQCGADPATNQNGNTVTADRESEAILSELNQALSITEDLEPEKAETLWKSLKNQLAGDPSVLLNRALNAVLLVDTLAVQATDSVKTNEEKMAARAKLPAAIDAARAAVDDFQNNSGDNVTSLWLDAQVDSNEANLLGSAISKSLRRDLFKKLTKAIEGPLGENASSVILGGTISELLEKMTDPVDGLPAAMADPARQTLRRLSDAQPDNLFLAMQALRLSVASQDAAATELVDRVDSLSLAVEPTLAAYTKPLGIEPKDLIDEVRSAIKASDWKKADQSMARWFNILTPLQIVRHDRRRASPHPLDRLSYDTVRRMSSELESQNPISANDQTIAFESSAIAKDAAIALPIDANLDLVVDLLTVSEDRRLKLLLQGDGGFSESGSLELAEMPVGMLATDLFMVDSSDSARLKVSHAQSTDQGSGTSSNQPDYSLQARHDTIPGLILYGKSGVQLIQIDTRSLSAGDSSAGDSSTGDSQRPVLAPVEKSSGLESLPSILTAVAGDLEGDGDLDLIFAAEEGGLRVFVNRGNRTFFEAPIGTTAIDSSDPILRLAVGDLDRDIDLDVVTLHRSGRIGMLENLLHLQFRLRYLDQIPKLEMADDDPALSLAIEDVDANVGWDVLATSSEQSLVAFGHSSDIGLWNVDRVETGAGFGSQPALADVDNDSFLEWIGTDRTQRLGPWGISELDPAKGITEQASRLIATELNQDGKLDLVSIGQGASTCINADQRTDGQLSVRFRGIADNAASSGRVNHYAIGSVLELRFGPYFRSRIINHPATHFGLGGVDQVDSIRVIMPNGLTQTIRQPKPNTVVEEDQTLKGSCPYLYSWDGEKFAFVTDCLWAAPLGLQVASGVVQKDRPWEYLKIDGDFVRANEDGQYELRLTEELWEVAYVDHVELTAVDHPGEVEVYTNEKVGPPDLAEPTIFAFEKSQIIPLRQAVDTRGNDVTKTLANSDQDFVKGFDRRIRQGLCPPHWIDLDFGEQAKSRLQETRDGSCYLMLRGWILPTDTSLNIQIDQNPELPRIEFPSLWVPDEDSPLGWKQAIEFIGFPGGKTKTIVVDVSEAINADDPRVRVRTTAQIYWDSASLVVQQQPAEVRTQAISLSAAQVAYHGFSTKRKPGPNQPETYDYADADLDPKWPPLFGQVTDFGDCTASLADWDDSMVVISGGDEIRMRFDIPDQPPPKGWKRDFVLHCVGWDKDADLNTLTGQAIAPLPIRDMSAYPPTVNSQTQFDQVLERNADSMRRRQSFRAFWRRGDAPSDPFLQVQPSR